MHMDNVVFQINGGAVESRSTESYVKILTSRSTRSYNCEYVSMDILRR